MALHDALDLIGLLSLQPELQLKKKKQFKTKICQTDSIFDATAGEHYIAERCSVSEVNFSHYHMCLEYCVL